MPIINFSAPTRIHRRKVKIGLRYEAAPNRVRESLLKAVRSVEGVLTNPHPYVQLVEYADFAINYMVFFFIRAMPRRERIENRVMTRIWYQLRRDALSVPFPIRDINMRQVTRDSELCVIDKDAFGDIIKGNEALVEAISQRLLSRQQELRKAREESESTQDELKPDAQKTLMSRIKSFFQM